MKVAINATAMRSLGHGVGNYIGNLGLALAKNYPNDRYLFIIRSDNTDLPKYLAGLDNVSFYKLSWPRPARILWEQLVLPFMARRYDILHSPVYVSPILKLTRYVLTEPDLTFFTEPEKHNLIKRIYFKTLIPISCKIADKILAISSSTAKDLVQILNIPAKKIVVTPLGVREDLKKEGNKKKLLTVKEKYQLPEKFVLFLGVLEPRKNVGGLIRAFSQISDKIKEDLVVAGSSGFGWNTVEVRQLVRDLKLTNRVHFIGTVNEQDKGAIFSLATVFVYPSFYEGFGIPLLEAMACDVPVITSRGSSLGEVSGDAARLVDPRKDQEIAGAILKVVKDGSVRDRMIRLGRQNVRRFSWKKTARQTYEAYKVL